LVPLLKLLVVPLLLFSLEPLWLEAPPCLDALPSLLLLPLFTPIPPELELESLEPLLPLLPLEPLLPLLVPY